MAKSYSEMFNRQIVDANNKRMTELAREMSKLETPGQYRKYTDPKGYELADEYDRLMEQKLSRAGALYTVDLDVEPEDLLDWDKPLSEQSAKVRQALEEHGFDGGEYTVRIAGEDLNDVFVFNSRKEAEAEAENWRKIGRLQCGSGGGGNTRTDRCRYLPAFRRGLAADRGYF